MTRELGNQDAARRALLSLAAELETRHFHVRLREVEGRSLCITIVNIAAPVLTESVLTAPDAEGALWFWFPWRAPISPVKDVLVAADRVERSWPRSGGRSPERRGGVVGPAHCRVGIGRHHAVASSI
ncbi:hypothetical protein [Nonomuraea sediminis]|uniref:hypothetical protein n=1 Tax=Nonomuraea sediminis TaxID=2835864 RepID=UPI001BDD4E31|nr:hypothetical protein [Nonomuraea sediminis]